MFFSMTQRDLFRLVGAVGLLVQLTSAGELSGQPARRDSISLSDIPLDRPAFAAFLAKDTAVLVSGPAQYLALLTPSNRSAVRFASQGEGPGEWRSVDALFGCVGHSGWVDGRLRRIVWLDPASGRYDRQLALSTEAGAAGKPVAAACENGSLWIAFEGRTRGTGTGIVRDTVKIFHLDEERGAFTLVTQVAGSARMLKNKGSLNASLRLPWALPPALVALGQQRVGVVLRTGDSMYVYSATRGSERALPLGRAGRAFTTRAQAITLDSMRQVIEDEMEALKYEEVLRAEFRILQESLRADVVFPARWPLVRFAAADPATVGGLVVVEHADMQTGESCVTVLAPTGRAQRRRCYAWPGRTVHGVLPDKASLLWFQSNVDGESWMIRTARP